jgi:Glu-tRNA(Gln) amidotransferase subunit E-like FAD-binding protein
MSRDEVVAIVKALAGKNPGGFTALMKATMAELKGRADGKLVSEVVKEATQ